MLVFLPLAAADLTLKRPCYSMPIRYPQMFYLLSSNFFDKTSHLIKIPREYSISFLNHIYPWYLYEIYVLYWNNHTVHFILLLRL